MNRPNLTLLSRIALVIASLAIIFAHESVRGVITMQQGSETAVPSDPASVRRTDRIAAGIPDAFGAAGLVISNGGFRQDASSWYAKQNVRLTVVKKEDQTELVRGFVRGDFDIIALPPDSFAALYPSLSALHPVAFILSGSTGGPAVIAAKEKFPSIASLAKKRVSCVEKSPAHFLLLYLLKENGIHPRDIRWVFTLTDDDAARLFECGKADAVVCRSGFSRRALPASAHILFSTDSAPAFNRCVLVARETDLVVRPDLYRKIVTGVFETRKALAAMNDADAATLAEKCAGIKSRLKGNPAWLIPSLDENSVFFRMTEKREWDYALAYQTARELYSVPAESEGLDITATQNVFFLDSLDPAAYASKGFSPQNTAAAGADIVLFSQEIPFAKNTTDPAYPSRLPLAHAAMNAQLFQSSRIMTKGNAAADEINAAWLAGARENSVHDAVSKLYAPAAQRFFPSGEKPAAAISATLQFRAASPDASK